MKTTILCCIVLLFVACPVFGQFDPWSGSASVATPPALIASDAPVTAG